VVRDAVFGNVGSMVSFRVGADDAAFLAKYYAPQFEPGDLMQLHNRYFVSTMTINGEKSPPFSGSTLNQPVAQENYTEAIVQGSRQRYAVPRDQIEDRISSDMGVLPYGRSQNMPPRAPERPLEPKTRVINPVKAVFKASGQANTTPVTTEVGKKRKRTRSRRKKSSHTHQTNSEQIIRPQAQSGHINEQEEIIHLR
jgi:hypothetical protein